MTDLVAQAERLLPATLALLADLVAVDTGTGQSEGIRYAGAILDLHLARCGFTVTHVPAAEYGQHLVARRPGKGRPILILGHLDTVYPEGAARRPARDGERFMGPGVYDCKGGLVLFLTACEIWAAHGWPSPPLTAIVNADEEIGSLSSRSLIEAEAHRALAALVVEPAPGLNQVITSRKGVGRFVLRVFGRAAHAGTDREAGINALVELAAKILALERLNAAQNGYAVTVGTAAGGVRPNVVPDYAQAEIDLRLSEPGQIAPAEAAIARAAAVSEVPGAHYNLEGGITRPPMPESAGNRRLFDLAVEVGATLGLNLVAAASGGGSDANFCAALGLPTLDGLGAVGAGAHTEHEHILWSTLPRRAALLAALGLRLGEVKPPDDRAQT